MKQNGVRAADTNTPHDYKGRGMRPQSYLPEELAEATILFSHIQRI